MQRKLSFEEISNFPRNQVIMVDLGRGVNRYYFCTILSFNENDYIVVSTDPSQEGIVSFIPYEYATFYYETTEEVKAEFESVKVNIS